MSSRWIKYLLVLSYSIFFLLVYKVGISQEDEHNDGKTEQPQERVEKKEGSDANEVIFGHVADAHEYHFLSYKCKDGKDHHATIPLPVILYSPQRGLDVF